MSRRARAGWYGTAALLVVLGAAVTAVLGGTTGDVAGFVLIGLGLVQAMSLVFFEVGISEDRERARTMARAERAARAAEAKAQAQAQARTQGQGKREGRRLKPLKLDRSRGHRRRLG